MFYENYAIKSKHRVIRLYSKYIVKGGFIFDFV